MRVVFLMLCIFLLGSCGDETGKPKDISTVDSNILEPVDNTPVTLHLDSLNDTVALDSIGPTINPEDTNYTRQ